MFDNIFNNTRKFIILSIIALSGMVSVNSLFGYKLILVNESDQDVVFSSENGPLRILKGGSFITKDFWESYSDALNKFVDKSRVQMSYSKHDRLYYDKGFFSKTFGVTPVWTEVMRHFIERPTPENFKKTVKDIRSLDSTDADSFVVIKFLNNSYWVTFIDKAGNAIRFKCAHFKNFFGFQTGSYWYQMETFKLPKAPQEIYSNMVDSIWEIAQAVKDGRVLPLTKFIEEFNENSEFIDLLGGKVKFGNELIAADKISANSLSAQGVEQQVSKKGQEGRDMIELGRFGKEAEFKRVDKGFKPGVGPNKYKSKVAVK